MDSQDWLQNTHAELVELAANRDLAGDDAWRAAVLVGRLLASPHGPFPPEEVVRRLPELLAGMSLPPEAELLNQLHRELESSVDASGPLHDIALDVDDVVTLEALRGDDERAAELARRAAGLVALYAERVLPLFDFASMRLHALRDDSPVRTIWEAVRSAPAEIVADALPEQSADDTPSRANRPRVVPLRPPVVHIPVPALAYQQAASTAAPTIELRSEETNAAFFEEGGRQRLEVRPVTPGATLSLRLLRAADGAEIAVRALPMVVHGRTGVVDLGPATGVENFFQALLLQVAATPREVTAELVVRND